VSRLTKVRLHSAQLCSGFFTRLLVEVTRLSCWGGLGVAGPPLLVPGGGFITAGFLSGVVGNFGVQLVFITGFSCWKRAAEITISSVGQTFESIGGGDR
jgi:hypothetical protein